MPKSEFSYRPFGGATCDSSIQQQMSDFLTKDSEFKKFVRECKVPYKAKKKP